MLYRGYDIFYDEDGGGYYAQDFSDPGQPTSELYESVADVKAAILNGEIRFK